jgi:hypothetical protein
VAALSVSPNSVDVTFLDYYLSMVLQELKAPGKTLYMNAGQLALDDHLKRKVVKKRIDSDSFFLCAGMERSVSSPTHRLVEAPFRYTLIIFLLVATLSARDVDAVPPPCISLR